MKRAYVVVSVIVGVVVTTAVAGVSFALESSSTASPTAVKTTETTAPASTESKTELNTRVKERQTRLKTKLNNTETNRIKGQCTSAQAKFNGINKKVTDDNLPYDGKITAYIKRLETIQQKLQAGGKSNAELSAAIATLNQKYQAYKASYSQLNLSLSDLKSVDCKASPDGFKATLVDARTQANTVKAQRKELNSYIKDTVKKLLQNLKAAGTN
jgi:chromosome segregation ATPase